MIRNQKKIGEILIECSLITQEQLERALSEQARTNQFLGDILLKNKDINERDLLLALSKQFNMPFINLNNEDIDWEFINKFSASLLLDYQCIPILEDEWSVTIGIRNPLDVDSIKKAEEEARGLKLRLVLVSKDDLEEFIGKYKQHKRLNIEKL
jgi:type IV pilus assembly protein PilB